MNFDGWVEGYKVNAFDWIDGKSIYMNIQYFRPGQSLSAAPAFDKSFLIDKCDEEKVRRFISSVVLHLAHLPVGTEKNPCTVNQL